MKHIPLHAPNANAPLVAQMIEYPPGTAGTLTATGHSVCSVVYVLEGKLQLDSGGMHEALEAGDCAYLDSDMPIAWSAGGPARCRALVVTPGKPREA